MEILKFSPPKNNNGGYQGSVNVKMNIRYQVENDWIEDVLTINKIKIFKNKYGKRFISLPQHEYEKDGEKNYFPFNHLIGKDKFEVILLQNLDQHQVKQTQDAQQNEDVPF